jgi:general secretion pathway protein J
LGEGLGVSGQSPFYRFSPGFTLVEILIALAILSIVMSILYGTFSSSSANARVVEERAEELSSLTGALDVLSQEVRGAYPPSEASEAFSGRKEGIAFTVMTPFVRENEAVARRASYLFDEGRLIRRLFQIGKETEVQSESLLLEGVGEPSFSFFDGKEWVEEWPSEKGLPYGVKVTFSYKGRDVETVIPVISKK